jgi:hypothetical protein
LAIKTVDPYPDFIELLDPDSINPDPQVTGVPLPYSYHMTDSNAWNSIKKSNPPITLAATAKTWHETNVTTMIGSVSDQYSFDTDPGLSILG